MGLDEDYLMQNIEEEAEIEGYIGEYNDVLNSMSRLC